MIKKILILLVVGAIAAIFVYKYAMRPVADTSEMKPDVSITFTDINSKMNASAMPDHLKPESEFLDYQIISRAIERLQHFHMENSKYYMVGIGMR
jgi:hypothetical protein